MTVQLEFKNLTRRFGGATPTTALANIDLTLEPGSFTAIVGPSGCGKSTLMHIAAGLDSQYEGSFAQIPQDAAVACLFQSPRLLPWLSALRNVAFVLESHGFSRSDATDRAKETLRIVGLDRFRDRYPSQLSGGMQQRVALARALAVDPQVLLMDEPFAALDELTAQRMRQELMQLFADQDRTIMFVTHNLYEACYLADQVVVMSAHPGKIVANISIDIDRPRSYEDARLGPLVAEVRSYIEDGTANDLEQVAS